MIESRRDLDLTLQASGYSGRLERRGQVGPYYFEGNGTMMPLVSGERDRRHPSATDFALDRAASSEGIHELAWHAHRARHVTDWPVDFLDHSRGEDGCRRSKKRIRLGRLLTGAQQLTGLCPQLRVGA